MFTTCRPDSLLEKSHIIMNEPSMRLFFVHSDTGSAHLLHDSCNVAKHTGKEMETLY